MCPATRYEVALRKENFRAIAGIDEAGRGPLAGPVVAAAVIFPPQPRIHGLDDSKKLSAQEREKLFPKIIKKALAFGVGIIEPELIERLNILWATQRAMRQAIANLSATPDYLLVDGPQKIPLVNIPQKAIVAGDAKCVSIAAASVIAKVSRDRIMDELDKKYPQYGFAKHKGYATKEHLQAIEKHGPAPCHRQTFGPIKPEYVQETFLS